MNFGAIIQTAREFNKCFEIMNPICNKSLENC